MRRATESIQHAGWGRLCIWVVLLLGVSLGGLACGTSGNAPAEPVVPLAFPRQATLAVVGVQRDLPRGAEVIKGQDQRLGFGLTALLAEALADRGAFRLIEEKDVQQRGLVDDMVRTYTVTTRAAYTVAELAPMAQQLEVAALAYGRVVARASQEERFELGPLSRAQQTLRLAATACVYSRAAHRSLCHTAMGEAQQTRTGALFELRDTTVDFEKNAVGRATRQAVLRAVEAVLANMHFTP